MTRHFAVLALAWLVLTGASDATIRFAARQQPPPPDIPRDGRRAGPADARDHGPLGALVMRRLASIEITWWEPKIFAKESAVRGYLGRLLATPRGSTVTFIPWAQMLPVASLGADVVESDGRRGRLLVWHQLPSVYAAWQDGDGRWWFAYWMDDPDLRVTDDAP